MRIESPARSHWPDIAGGREGVIFAFWHNRLLFMPYAVKSRSIAALISSHRDGELISRTISSFGHSAVRGSTTRGGGEAMRKMVRLLRDGTDVAITPDGPRGPRYKVQPGVVQLARLSGRPIFPLTFASDRFVEFGSWDRFQMPKPFSRGMFLWGEPMTVSRTDDLEERRLELEGALNDLTRQADSRVAQPAAAAECPPA